MSNIADYLRAFEEIREAVRSLFAERYYADHGRKSLNPSSQIRRSHSASSIFEQWTDDAWIISHVIGGLQPKSYRIVSGIDRHANLQSRVGSYK